MDSDSGPSAQQLLDALPFGAAYLDSSLRYKWINERLAEMNGRTPAEHVGVSILDILPGAFAEPVAILLKGVLESGAAVENLDLEVESPAAPNTRLHLRVSFARVPDGDDFGILGLVEVA